MVAQTKPVFGVPLADAVARAQVREGFELPAVVFRCVEYLQAKSAVNEEGLYRLSYVSSTTLSLLFGPADVPCPPEAVPTLLKVSKTSSTLVSSSLVKCR